MVVPFLDAVQTDHPEALQHRAVQALDSAHAVLLLDGEDALQRRVGELRLVQDGQDVGDARAVIGAQSGAVGVEPAVLLHEFDGIFQEVVGAPGLLGADHVGVGLEHQGGFALPAGRGGGPEDEVVQRIPLEAQAPLLGEALDVVHHRLLVEGLAGDAADLPEIMQISVFRVHSVTSLTVFGVVPGHFRMAPSSAELTSF